MSTAQRLTGEMVRLPLVDLIEDLTIYPRHHMDEVNVGRLVAALHAHEVLPPIIVDKKSHRIADGFHRKRAYLRVLGVTGEVDVEVRTYRTEADLILAAIALNAGHGRQLDKQDQVRCVHLAKEHGIDLVRVAAVLHKPMEAVERLLVRVATVPAGAEGAIPGTQQMVMKRPVLHLAGTTLTKEQANAMPSVPGTSYALLARQLTDAVTRDLADRSDAPLMAALRGLHTALGHYLDAVVA